MGVKKQTMGGSQAVLIAYHKNAQAVTTVVPFHTIHGTKKTPTCHSICPSPLCPNIIIPPVNCQWLLPRDKDVTVWEYVEITGVCLPGICDTFSGGALYYTYFVLRVCSFSPCLHVHCTLPGPAAMSNPSINPSWPSSPLQSFHATIIYSVTSFGCNGHLGAEETLPLTSPVDE